MKDFLLRSPRFHKKELFALILLLIALPVSLFLVQRNQELREKAGGGPIFFHDTQGNGLPTGPDGIPVSNSLEVQVELNAP